MDETRKPEFNTTEQSEVPTGRRGKHDDIVQRILYDLGELQSGKALKIPLADLPDSKVNIRSALSRATRKLGKNVSTAADETYLYVWND